MWEEKDDYTDSKCVRLGLLLLAYGTKKGSVMCFLFCCDQKRCRKVVEVTGLEPMASWSRTKRATNCATPRNVCALQLPIYYRVKRKKLQQNNSK